MTGKGGRIGLGILLLLSLVGCASIGPPTVTRDRFEYTAAIGDSWKRQMLMNIVKLRYGDIPVFLDVASVISQYALEQRLDFNLSWAFPPNSNAQEVGGFGKFTDRPTITYSPLMGERLARSLMKPIPPTAILSLIQAGYPADQVLRVCVHSINGIRNRFGGEARPRRGDPEFYPLIERMRRLQDSGAIGLRIKRNNDNNGAVMVLRGKIDPSLEEDSAAIRKILGLDPKARQFRVTYGAVAENNREVAILSRSLLEILTDFASFIEVPAVHVAEKRVKATFLDLDAAGNVVAPLMQIDSMADKPDDLFVAVPYRGHWFWIDDRDLPSKRMFSFLMFVFTLTETGDRDGAPIVTIPAG